MFHFLQFPQIIYLIFLLYFLDFFEKSINFVTINKFFAKTYNQLNIKDMIPENIRSLRKKLGYTQEQIAEYLDISTAAVTQYETGARVVPASTVSKLALLFNVDEYELYQEDPQQQQLLSAFAFRANELHPQDLKSISEFKKIVLNYFHLSNELNSNE